MTTASTVTAPRRRRLLNRRMIRVLVALSIDLYGAGIVLYVLLRLLTAERLWPVALLNNVIAWVLLPALPLAALMAALRHWKRAALTGIGALTFSALYGGLFLPSLQPNRACAADSACRSLRIMTYNLAADSAPPERVAAAIRASGADIVGLQELGPAQAAEIERSLADIYPYRLLYGEGVPGKGFLSRYPILESSPPFYIRSAHPHLMVVVDVDGIPLTVLVAHPVRPRLVRWRYMADPTALPDIQTLAMMAAHAESSILMGDFNTTDQTSHYAVLREAGLIDTFREAGWGLGPTFPTRWSRIPFPPLVRIDFIWHTAHLRATRAWVGDNAGSDHLPVLADLVWSP
jgi:vancomycin resistance protein VanJ